MIAHGQIGSFVLGIDEDIPVALQDLLDELLDPVGEDVQGGFEDEVRLDLVVSVIAMLLKKDEGL